MPDKQPKGKAIVIEADAESPNPAEIKQMRDLARRVGLFALAMLEAEEYKGSLNE
jgi:hypothetical protein